MLNLLPGKHFPPVGVIFLRACDLRIACERADTTTCVAGATFLEYFRFDFVDYFSYDIGLLPHVLL